MQWKRRVNSALVAVKNVLVNSDSQKRPPSTDFLFGNIHLTLTCDPKRPKWEIFAGFQEHMPPPPPPSYLSLAVKLHDDNGDDNDELIAGLRAGRKRPDYWREARDEPVVPRTSHWQRTMVPFGVYVLCIVGGHVVAYQRHVFFRSSVPAPQKPLFPRSSIFHNMMNKTQSHYVRLGLSAIDSVSSFGYFQVVELESSWEAEWTRVCLSHLRDHCSNPDESDNDGDSLSEGDIEPDDGSPGCSTNPHPVDDQPYKRRKTRYHCDHDGCGKSFARKDGMLSHQKSSHDNVLFPCRFPPCTKSYSRDNVRLRHENVEYHGHRKQCTFCKKAFKRKPLSGEHPCPEANGRPLSYVDSIIQ